MTRPLTDRQYELLNDLVWRPTIEWVTPMFLGGRDASWHSAVLAQLVAKKFVERRPRGSDRSFTYRATGAGRLAHANEQARRFDQVTK